MMCLGHLSDGHGRVGDIDQRKLGRLHLAELIGKDTGARVRSDTCGRILLPPRPLNPTLTGVPELPGLFR